jgi:malonyl-CoA/methylmalonyl-CoA synthetase
LNFTKFILEKAARAPNKPAIVFENNTYTYGDLNNLVKRYAGLLAWLGIKKGDRVALQLPNCLEFIILHLAIMSLGAITLPLNTAYKAEEVNYFLNDSKSSLFFVNDERLKQERFKLKGDKRIKTIFRKGNSSNSLKSLLAQSQKNGANYSPDYPTESDDIALLCYTSGTTGKPKGAMIIHRNLITNALALQKVWKWTENDILLNVLPMFHIHGLCVALHGALNACSKVIIHEKFDPRNSLETIEKERCTMFMAVPTIYYRLLNVWPELKTDLSSMRLFISGSAPLSEELFERFYSATGFPILERYGMTETQIIASNPYEPEKRIPKSVGYPLPGIQIRLISESGVDVKPGEIGELLVKGENVFKGYWQMPEKTKDSFLGDWFRTGDLGYQDEKDGMRLYLVGRSKELIISGGYNVYPKEVEDVLNQHDSVQESAVLGISDQEYGEKVVAAVVLKEKQPLISDEILIAFCKEKLASYKCPKKIIFLDELPRNALGKIQKHLIVDLF